MIHLTKSLNLLIEAMIMADDCGAVLRLKNNTKYKFNKNLRKYTRKEMFSKFNFQGDRMFNQNQRVKDNIS